MGKTLFLWPFSIAMFVYQRVLYLSWNPEMPIFVQLWSFLHWPFNLGKSWMEDWQVSTEIYEISISNVCQRVSTCVCVIFVWNLIFHLELGIDNSINSCWPLIFHAAFTFQAWGRVMGCTFNTWPTGLKVNMDHRVIHRIVGTCWNSRN